MNASFGIDHPLIAVRNLELLRNRMIAMGFNMTVAGKHPWGTSTSLAMFEGCLIEIMGIYDDTLLDEVPAGDFKFGRHVHHYLQEREGVALTALHSTDSQKDAAHASKFGFEVSGHLEFGRDVTLPDGRIDRTKTTLALMPDAKWPRLSFFLCQQHRPELIYVPSWLLHPNTVHGISGVTILAAEHDMPALSEKLMGLYGASQIVPGGFTFDTANGDIRVLSEEAILAEYGDLPPDVSDAHGPCIIAMHLKYHDMEVLEASLMNSGIPFSKDNASYTLDDPIQMGNTFFKFVPSQGT